MKHLVEFKATLQHINHETNPDDNIEFESFSIGYFMAKGFSFAESEKITYHKEMTPVYRDWKERYFK